MRDLMAILSVFLSLLLLATNCHAFKRALSSSDDICELFPYGAILRKPGSCTETIKCNNGESSPHTVKCSDGKIVKLDKMTCAAETGKTIDKYCTPTCTKSSPMFIEDTKSCKGWGVCEAGKLIQQGDCPYGQIFDKELQRCIYDNGECDKTYDICQVAKTNQKFWNQNNCQKYYYCNAKSVLVSAKCPISTYYEVSTGNCVSQPQLSCSERPLPERVCGTKKLAILNRFVADQSTCRGYYYCKDLGTDKDGNYIPDESPVWKQCSTNQFFDEELQYCRDMNNVKCNEDRCDSRASGMILSERRGCQHYLICKDNYTTDEVKCPDNRYFDPIAGSCVDEFVWYPICS